MSTYNVGIKLNTAYAIARSYTNIAFDTTHYSVAAGCYADVEVLGYACGTVGNSHFVWFGSSRNSGRAAAVGNPTTTNVMESGVAVGNMFSKDSMFRSKFLLSYGHSVGGYSYNSVYIGYEISVREFKNTV